MGRLDTETAGRGAGAETVAVGERGGEGHYDRIKVIRFVFLFYGEIRSITFFGSCLACLFDSTLQSERARACV